MHWLTKYLAREDSPRRGNFIQGDQWLDNMPEIFFLKRLGRPEVSYKLKFPDGKKSNRVVSFA